MSTGAFIVARLSSTRLPRKNIREILRKPMIEHLADRIRAAKLVDKVVIATSGLPSDDPLEELASHIGIGCYRGSLDNVMERITGAARAFECDTIVEILGDNPLVHSDVIDRVITLYKEKGLDYAATVTREYPVDRALIKLFSVGVRVQVYSQTAAARYVDFPEFFKNEDRGYSAYIFENPSIFKIGYLEACGDFHFMNRPDINFAVNYPDNFDAVRIIFERLYPADNNFSLKDVYSLFDTERYLYHMLD